VKTPAKLGDADSCETKIIFDNVFLEIHRSSAISFIVMDNGVK
jgi:hypothetical protein